MPRFARLVMSAALAVVAALACTAPAGATTNAGGPFGEPAFTNSQSNTHWVEWTKFSSYYRFYLAVTPFVNGTAGSVSTSSFLGGQGFNVNNVSGNENITWGPGPLTEGVSYGICASGQYSLDNTNLFFPESQSSCGAAIISSRRTITTIDRTKPVIQVAVSGADTYTKTVPIPVTINYSDNLAFPFPANYICARTGVDPAQVPGQCGQAGQFAYAPVCSSPANAGSNVTSFSCTVTDSPPVPDGPVTVCAKAADSSIPDNPSGPNQNSSSDFANISLAQCGYVNVDRTAPQASFTAPAAVTTGTLVTATGTVTDAGSGAGAVSWNWGDNTAGSAGISSTHTYTQPGTYTITMSTADAVGNPASKTATITVSAPAPGGGGTPGSGTPGGGTATGGGGTVTPPPTAQEIARQVGGTGGAGATQTTSAGALDVLTAKKVKITAKLKSLPLALTAETAGTAGFALVSGGRIVSKSGLKITKPGSLGFKLKLPKKLKAGRYSLKITFTPDGASKASSKTIRITFTAAKKKKKARRSARAAAVSDAAQLVGAPAPSLPDGRLHAKVRAGDGIHIRRR